jgi:competence protein ComEA
VPTFSPATRSGSQPADRQPADRLRDLLSAASVRPEDPTSVAGSVAPAGAAFVASDFEVESTQATAGAGSAEPPARAKWLSARLPDTLRSGRLALEGRALLALVLLAAAAVLVTAWFALRGSTAPTADLASVVSGGSAVAGVSSTPTGAGSAASTSKGSVSSPVSTASPTALVVVDVAGRVRRAGLVRLPVGARVADAIQAAGGALPGVDLTSINLAKVVSDGEQVLVGAATISGSQTGGGHGSAGSPTAAGAAGTGAGAGAGGIVNLNTATLEQLQTLPGVGPVLAQRILDWRTAHGRFSSVDDLREVSGIGDRRFADLAPLLRV